jgi:hypothetical protein
MEIFLMVLSLSLVGVLVSGVLFAAANRDVQRTDPPALVPATVAGEERFFMMRPPAKATWGGAPVTADVLALQIERHVRLEQAAAERFHEFPSVEALRTPTLSPLAG